jgi:hemoglobin-like flavoprotein
MTPAQIQRVQESFKKVAPHAELAARMFYDRLFVIAPEVKPLFHGDMAEQGRKLMSTLAVVVNGLTNLEGILPAAKSLAVKHVGYGVQPDHYKPVGEALVWTLQEALGDSLDGETRDAWIEAYTLLSGVMISEAYGLAMA